MSRASRNLCFLISVTLVNVIIYVAMSGNFLVFKRSEPMERTSNMRRLNGELYQEKISQLVREAVRDHGVSKQNLTAMLERAIREHGATEPGIMDDFFIHQGKTDPFNRTGELQSGVMSGKQGEQSNNEQDASNLLGQQPQLLDVEDIKNAGAPDPEQNKEKAKEPPPPDANGGGMLNRLSDFINGPKQNKPVVFPHDYNLVLNEPNKCKNDDGSDRPVFFLVFIMSIHKNFDQRNAIRRTWGSPQEIDGKKIVTLFLLAKNNNPLHQPLVEQESKQYHDILMEDFVDTYKNLTLKTMMGMKWASIFCPHANFVMKTDDDMYVSYDNAVKHLVKSSTPIKNYVTGFVINGGPIRDPKSKWYMPRETYPGGKYPPFCSGTGYMMSGDVPAKVFEKSLYTPFLYLEDVYFAVCLDALHIVPVNHKSFNNWRTPYSYCKYKRIFTTHMVAPTEMHRIWDDQKTSKGYHC